MCKVLLVLFMAVGMSSVSFSQGNKIVKWQFSAKKIADKTYEIYCTATISSPWHIYSQNIAEGGPIPTSFTFNKNPLLILNGKVKEAGKLIEEYEEVFDMQVKYYENKVDFVQIVKLKSNVKTSIGGTISFMVCNAHECLPPGEQKFSIPLQ